MVAAAPATMRTVYRPARMTTSTRTMRLSTSGISQRGYKIEQQEDQELSWQIGGHDESERGEQ